MVRRRRPLIEATSDALISTRRTISRQVPTPCTSWVVSATCARRMSVAGRQACLGMESISSQITVVRLTQMENLTPLFAHSAMRSAL